MPDLDFRVWILIAGRLLSQVGTGFTLFYAPIFFVNRVGLSATLVGVGLGIGAIAGVLGRILGGSFADMPQVGRRRTLLLSAAVSAVASAILAITFNVPTFLLGNLLMGLGIGLYWPATETVVADLTTIDQRNEAYALARLGDSLGLGLGVALGGTLIAATGSYRALFVIDAISYVIFFGIVYRAIAETRSPGQPHQSMLQSWKQALGDVSLLIFTLVCTLFTTYLALLNSTLPLYFANFVPTATGQGFSTSTISVLFSGYVALTALTQLPVIRRLQALTQPQMLIVSALFWAVGFGLIWATGVARSVPLIWAVVALVLMAIATAAYTPGAASLVVALAPVELRGVYLSVNSLCWAAGYFIGPVLGGWAMDGSARVAHGFWLACVASILPCVLTLQYLDHRIFQEGRHSR
ncbi:MAG: MFS transporter [Cyanobacteria bacterium J069]